MANGWLRRVLKCCPVWVLKLRLFFLKRRGLAIIESCFSGQTNRKEIASTLKEKLAGIDKEIAYCNMLVICREIERYADIYAIRMLLSKLPRINWPH